MSGYVPGTSPHHELPPDANYIEKPFTANSLGSAIRALLDK